jgi:NADP-dependent aldehyde dehydrogenase
MRSYDPRTGRPFGDEWPDTGQAELRSICDTAATAVPYLRDIGAEGRRGLLDAVAGELESRRDELVAIADRETALGPQRLGGELTRTCFQLRFLGDAVVGGDHLRVTIDPATDSPMGPLPDLRRMMVPIGPVAVFAASNFPFAFSVPGGDTASALAAGCPVVVKVHPAHPATSAAVADAIGAALGRLGAPAGVFATVSGVEAGRELVGHPAIKAVAFTGSTRGGRALFDLACSRPDPIPFYGELGSINPVVVTSAAAAARTAEIATGWTGSVLLGGGQFCTKPGLLLVPEATRAAFAEAAGAAFAAAAAPYLLNEPIHRGYQEGSAKLCRSAASAPPATDGLEGYAAAPAVHTMTLADALGKPDVLEEVFGPTGVILGYDDVDDVRRLAAAIGGSLTATVHGEPGDPQAAPLIEILAGVSGRVIWNGYPTGVAVSRSMQHGGPWPSSTSVRDTSVGSAAIDRFVRPVAFQSMPQDLLPEQLRDPA